MVILRPADKADKSPTTATWPLPSFVAIWPLGKDQHLKSTRGVFSVPGTPEWFWLLVPNSCAPWGDGWTVSVPRLLPLCSQLIVSSDQAPCGIWAPPSMFVSLLGMWLHKNVKEKNLVVFDLRMVWRKLIKTQLMLGFCYKLAWSAHGVIWEIEYAWKKKPHRKEISY